MHPDRHNHETIASYEQCALEYARSTAPRDGEIVNAALSKLIEFARTDFPVLEIGSGPGWDADWLELRGLHVIRTDAAKAFVDFQLGRGKAATVLDVVHNDLGGPYAAVSARYVFQHIDRDLLPSVFARVFHTLLDEGVFLFTLREGNDTHFETGSDGRRYYIAMWRREALEASLVARGFEPLWCESSRDADGHWLSMLLRKRKRHV